MKLEFTCGEEITIKEVNKLKLELMTSGKGDVEKELERLKKNKNKVHNIKTEETIDLLDRCAKLWLDDNYSKKHIETLAQITNQSFELVNYEFKSMMQMLLRENIQNTIKRELGEVDILDSWHKTNYGYEHRQPRGIIFHNISGNAFVVIPMSISMGLLSKNCNLVKVSKDEPYFAYAFYKSLCELDETVKDRLSVLYFDSSKTEIYDTIVKNSDGVIHWGGEYSSRIIGEMCAKYQKHMIMHGAKISFEVVDKCDDLNKVSEEIAKDIICWEQKACLSPRVVFLNDKIDADEFSHCLSASLRKITEVIPKAYLSEWNSVKTIQDRQYCTLKYGMKNEKRFKVYSSFNADYTVILSDRMPEKEDINKCFYRFIFVCPYSSKNEVVNYVSENLKDYLQTMGYSGNDEEFIEKMTLLGVSIVTKPGKMSLHEPGTSHDGIHNLKEFTFLVSRQI
ncbi:acyl-CoA reductase [Clostridium acetobutylicum]|nr:acyl-CoA reductase [Clostridium acetobutylicum]